MQNCLARAIKNVDRPGPGISNRGCRGAARPPAELPALDNFAFGGIDLEKNPAKGKIVKRGKFSTWTGPVHVLNFPRLTILPLAGFFSRSIPPKAKLSSAGSSAGGLAAPRHPRLEMPGPGRSTFLIARARQFCIWSVQ